MKGCLPMKNKSTLVVMAAGLGSRFGGGKQIEPMGSNGEIITDFSVYDAVNAGITHAVFIIKKDMEKEFREICGKRIEKIIDVDYVFQDYSSIPSFFEIPKDRTKPFGTVHAILCAKEKVNTPFITINADDYYGFNTIKIVNDYLTGNDSMCMAGFKLENTITENGKVSRGVCSVKDGFLTGINEVKEIDKNSGIPLDSTVSMNMWGFKSDAFDIMEECFGKFLKDIKNPKTDEFILTDIINYLLNKNEKIRVLDTPDKWYGITYKEDVPSVKEYLSGLIKCGQYKW